MYHGPQARARIYKITVAPLCRTSNTPPWMGNIFGVSPAATCTRASPCLSVVISGMWRPSTVISPSAPGTVSECASPSNNTSSTFAITTCILVRLDRVDAAFHVKSGFRFVVVLALQNFFKRADGLLHRHVHARNAGKQFRHVHRLGEEALYLARAVHQRFVLVGQLLDTEDGDDILQVFVTLEHLLGAQGDVVVLLADDARVERRGVRFQWVHRGEDA